MSDTYQAVYDAVRSRITGCDVGLVLQDALCRSFDISHAVPGIVQDIQIAAAEHRRPSVLFRPSLAQDGNRWIACYGADIVEGVVGVGRSPAEAMCDFDQAWERCELSSEPLSQRNPE